MPPEPGRHALYLDDAGVLLIERAMLAYRDLLHVQSGAGAGPLLSTEAEATAHYASIVQEHRRCTCPLAIVPLAPLPRPEVPIEERPRI
jgi:hypothetical protein